MPTSITSSTAVVAAVQAAPYYLNLERSLKRAIDLIAEAAKRRAQLVVFPETWLPGYPAWLDVCRDIAVWDHEPTKRLYAQLMENSVAVPSRETEALGEAARRHNLTLVIGVHERVNEGPGRGTLYNSILTFGPTGELLNVHRKLVPTFTERLIWAQGDGDGLRVVETPAGRIGGLICWEHWMPLARQTLHVAGEDIHVSLWPSVKEMYQIASRHYAFEGRCFVVAAGGIMRRERPAARFGNHGPPRQRRQRIHPRRGKLRDRPGRTLCGRPHLLLRSDHSGPDQSRTHPRGESDARRHGPFRPARPFRFPLQNRRFQGSL